jgi:hypothetical protein
MDGWTVRVLGEYVRLYRALPAVVGENPQLPDQEWIMTPSWSANTSRLRAVYGNEDNLDYDWGLYGSNSAVSVFLIYWGFRTVIG